MNEPNVSLPRSRPHGVRYAAANVIRGVLIGMAELVPGVSGGTVALVTGVYERALTAGAAIVDMVRHVTTGPDRWTRLKKDFYSLDWWLLIPLGVGMVTTVLFLAGPLKGFVESRPVESRALFLGMVAASIAVPIMIAREDQPIPTHHWVAVPIAAVVAFLATGSQAAAYDSPPPLFVFGAAALAVCALALPGVSGSYLLLVMGLYEPTLGAVEDRDWGYIVVFAAGAFCGLVAFVKVLHWLLSQFRTVTMLSMAGLMLGSLRALWPWRSVSGHPIAGDEGWPGILVLVLLGAGVVATIMFFEHRSKTIS